MQPHRCGSRRVKRTMEPDAPGNSRQFLRLPVEAILARHGMPVETWSGNTLPFGHINRMHSLERVFRVILPDRVTRRLTLGLARCWTVHPSTAHALFTLARSLRPAVTFETGTYWGYATTFLAAAVADAPEAKVYTIDLAHESGRYVPASLRDHIVFIRGERGVTALARLCESYHPTLFFQDSVHDYDGVRSELSIVAPHLMPGGVIAVHDAIAPEVLQALSELDVFDVFLVEGSDPQGLAVATKR